MLKCHQEILTVLCNFSERNYSFTTLMFLINGFARYLNKKKTAEEMEQRYQKTESVDYSLKEGETIVLQLKNVRSLLTLMILLFIYETSVSSSDLVS